MTPEVTTIFGLFDKTLSVLGLIRDGKKSRNEQIDQALFALYAALGETREYVTARKNGKRRDKKKEMSIARLWNNASIPLRYIDQDLASRCFLKGSYWLDPDIWDDKKVNRHRIELDTVFEEARQLLLKL